MNHKKMILMNSELWLLLELIGFNKVWKKYFDTSIEMDLYYKKLKNSTKVAIIDDSRNYYFPDYNATK